MQLSYCCTATCSRTYTAAAVAARIFQDISATKYTSISEIQWMLATSYRVEVAKTRISRDKSNLAVAGLQLGHLDHYKHVCRFVLSSYNRLHVRPVGGGHVAGGVDTPLRKHRKGPMPPLPTDVNGLDAVQLPAKGTDHSFMQIEVIY
jgi:hypothetical protein